MPVIYLDVLIALNLFIDFLLLSATTRILRIPYRRGRLVLGALFGSISSCLIFLPRMNTLMTFLVNITAGCLIVLIAFSWKSLSLYIKEIAVFLVVSAVFGGICYAIWYFIAPTGFTVVNGVVYYNISPLLLTLLTVVSYVAITLYDRVTHKKTGQGHDYRLRVLCEEGTVELRALYDTGHHVTDVFSGSPVVIVSYPSVERYVGKDLRGLLSDALNESFSRVGQRTTATAVQTGLRMIPYQTVSGTGLLPAFKPAQMLLVTSANEQTDITGCYVAVCRVLGRGDYEAIIGTDIVSLVKGGRAAWASFSG